MSPFLPRECLFNVHLLYFVYILDEQQKCGCAMQNEAAGVKQFLSATCFIRIATVLAHLDKINIDLNLRWEF